MYQKCRVYCITEATSVISTWVEAAITTCPNNPAHTIDDSSICVIDVEHSMDNDVATSDPTVNDDVDDGYGTGSRWLNTSSGARFICNDPVPGAAVWVRAAKDRMMFTVGGSSAGKWTGTGTSWVTARTVRFIGSAKMGNITAFRAIVGASGAYTGDIRLRDITNNKTVALVSAFSGDGNTVADTNPANVPADSAKFEVQMRGSNAAADVYLYFFEIVFGD